MKKFKRLLEELKKLDLPAEDYAIFGSGPLVIRSLRDANDIDIIVKLKLWKYLIKKYPSEYIRGHSDFVHRIKIGSIEIFKDWPNFNINALINNAEIIKDFKFVRLECVLAWKKAFGREKDKKDIKLIEDYLVKAKY